MAITECTENGVKLFNVSVSMRSRVKKGARVQKLKRGIKTLRAAQEVEKELIREVAMDLAKLENKTLTWEELLERFELTMRSGSATQKPMQANVLRETISFLRAFTPTWMKLDCREINPGYVRQIINTMEGQSYSQARMRQMKSSINSVFRFGIEEGILNGVHESPGRAIKLTRYVDDKPPMILKITEIHRLLENAKAEEHEWYPIWFTALNTGMRSGELYALLWSDIDWDLKLITVSKSWNNRLKGTKSTKAGYWRKVPMNLELELLLKELRSRTPIGQQQVLPRVSRWKNGEQAKYLRDFCRKIGIPEVTFHTLRACFATHLLNAGVPSPTVKTICGWTEEKVMTRYIRIAGLDISGATDVLDYRFRTGLASERVSGDNIVAINAAVALERNPLIPRGK